MITQIEEYFATGCGRCPRHGTADCSTRLWAEGLRALREICLAAGLLETVKWGHPCYMHAGRNIAIIGAFRGDFRLSFFDAALLDDPEGLLERQGPNSRPDALRFTDAAQVLARRETILSLLRQAMVHAEAGTRPPKDTQEVELPEELHDALRADPELAQAFHGLTPGRQKSHVLHLNSARTSATRVARIAKARGRILAGKGANER